MPSLRIDVTPLKAPRRKANGALAVDGVFSRAGVFTYRRADGSLQRELRLPEEVFDEASLKSLEAIPVVEDHPGAMLGNDAARAQGWTQEGVRRDGDLVVGSMLVTDPDLIASIEGGKDSLSVGYMIEEEPAPPGSVHPVYGPYDLIQRKIRGDHLAVVSMGRAGPEARIRMDAAVRTDYIVQEGDKWCVYSEGGQKLGSYDTKAEAVARLRQIEGHKAGGKYDADWDTAYVNDLPDSAFLYVEGGGDKDESGKTVPRTLRHFPYRNSGGEVDLPHLRNAAARIPQSDLPSGVKEQVEAKARNLLENSREKTDTETSPLTSAQTSVTLTGKATGIPMDETKKLQEALADATSRADRAEKALVDAQARADKAEGAAESLKAENQKLLQERKDAPDHKKLETEIVALKARLDQSEVALKKAEDNRSDAFAKAVQARTNLERAAKAVLGDKYRADLADRDLMLAVLDKLQGGVDKERSDEYVRARFDAAVESYQAGERAIRAIAEDQRATETARADSRTAREKMVAHNRTLPDISGLNK